MNRITQMQRTLEGWDKRIAARFFSHRAARMVWSTVVVVLAYLLISPAAYGIAVAWRESTMRAPEYSVIVTSLFVAVTLWVLTTMIMYWLSLGRRLRREQSTRSGWETVGPDADFGGRQ